MVSREPISAFVEVSGEPISGNSAREGVAGGSRASSLTGGQAGGGQPCRLSPGGAQLPGSGGERPDPQGCPQAGACGQGRCPSRAHLLRRKLYEISLVH